MPNIEQSATANQIIRSVRRNGAVAGAVLVSFLGISLNGCRDEQVATHGNHAPLVKHDSDGTVSTADGVVVRDNVPSQSAGEDFMPYTVSAADDAPSMLRSEFTADPCSAVLGSYAGEIACEPRDSSALLSELPR